MKNLLVLAILAAPVLGIVSCGNVMKNKHLPYPVARMDSTVDNYHGTQVADPYRWLEDDNSAETAAWVEAENAVTGDYLANIPFRDKLRERLTQLWDYPKEGIPIKVGEYYFSLRNNGLQNQSVLYRQRGLDGTPEVYFDPNALSDDGTVALGAISFSDDDKYFAYALSQSGSDWVEIHVMEVESGVKLADVIRWVKFSGAAWGKSGFYYSRYDEPLPGTELSAQNRFQKVYHHTLGTDQSADRLIYADDAHPLRYFHAGESEDGKYVFISGSEGTHGTELSVREVAKPDAKFTTLFRGFEYDYSVVECRDDRAWILTNQQAPNYKVIQVDLTNPAAPAREVIAENPEVLLEDVSSVGGYLVATYLEKAQNRVKQYNLDGELVREVELPGIGTVGGFAGKADFTETFFALTNFTAPATIYNYTLANGSITLFRQPEVKYDPSLYVAEQVFYPSADGTQVSMFVVHRKDMKLNGKNPTYLYGYGGFNINLTPGFSPLYIAMMEQGAVVAIPNLRGGGEYGEKWHHDAMLEKKQHTFDDFIAAAEYLIAQGYTSSEKIAIAGGSNGGLLVGACMTQRPDLFAVALPAVGVMDMLRFHKFTVGWGWTVEYGNSDNAADFEYLYSYSPLHNIVPGTCYPATLITTADHDDRVVPAHSFKFAATLQAAQGCDRPTLIRIDTKAGHGAGKPTSKRIEEATDVISFFLLNTDAKVKF